MNKADRDKMSHPAPGAAFASPLASLALALVLTVVAYFAAAALPVSTRLVLAFNLGTLAYLALSAFRFTTVEPEECAVMASEGEPSGLRAVITASVVVATSIVGVIFMLEPVKGWPAWVSNLHQVMSMLAVALSWVLFNLFVGLYYMRLYYDDHVLAGKREYRRGLDFPERDTPDYWDFMYYSFTIAMCYQTSDVSVTGWTMRRLTLVHAVLSFFFVVLILGLVVNALSNLV